MVELRKRKPREEPPAPPPSKKKSNPIKSVVDKAKNALGGTKNTNGVSQSTSKPTVGTSISLAGFGGEIETNDEEKVTLQKLVEQSKGGVAIFTYPKASTPGCTTQACLFRDAYTHLTATGLSIYGLSTDSPKANTTFKTKQTLPYPLLCDPSSVLLSAIGLAKPPKSATRGVFVIDKSGQVLANEPGGPQATVDVVGRLIKEGKVGTAPSAEIAEAVKQTVDEAPVAEKEDTTAIAAATETKPPITTTTNSVAPPSEIAAPAPASTTETSAAAPPATACATLEPPKLDEVPLATTPSRSEQEAADTAADVAETAAKIDGTGAVPEKIAA